MKKTYIDANTFMRDSWRLARKILDSEWKPDILIALWRGGAPVGVSVHEFLRVSGLDVRHICVKCKSYAGFGTTGNVVFSCAEEVFALLKSGERVLVIDDVFDTGKTALAVHDKLVKIGCDPKIATVYWKPEKNTTDLLPDFYTKTLNEWIVFPHEIEGLTPEEIAEKDPLLLELLPKR